MCEKDEVRYMYLTLCKQCSFSFGKSWVIDVVELSCGAQMGIAGLQWLRKEAPSDSHVSQPTFLVQLVVSQHLTLCDQ